MFRSLAYCLVALTVLPVALPAAERPNVLIIMADDCTHNDLPLYGGQNAKTPNLDALAAQGLTFNKAYLCSAMCQPCRAELFTGQYPMRNGCAWNHSASRPNVKSMPQRLGSVGYRVGIAGKVHVTPDSVFPFQKVAGFDANCVRNPTQSHDLSQVQAFLSDDTAPFCLVVALVEPHLPWVMGDASQYPPKTLKLPPNIADTERTRADFSRYLAEITYMDGQVGELLAALDSSGKAGDTLVLFTSEQGSQFPGCKWTNWDTGLHTALIARWPGRIPQGQRTDALVQYCDVLPTIMDLAGIAPAAELDGMSFRNVLEGASESDRKYVYGMHNNLPEGPAYPIRTVTDGQFRYIRNLTPNELYIEKHVMGIKGDGGLNNPYWHTWTWNAQEDPATYQLVKRYMLRPPEQFYHTTTDRYEMNNLAGDPSVQDRKQQLAAELDRWMTAQGDPGVAQDTMDALKAARRGMHLYVPE
ncbi:MAG: sulfatase [Planctomycetaceae bacterium]